MTKKEGKVESCSCENSCNCNNSSNCCAISIVTALAAIVAAIFAGLAYKAANESLNFTILQAGGQENFNQMKDVYSSKAYIEYADEQTKQAIEYFATEEDINEDVSLDEDVEDESFVEEDETESLAGETLSAEEVSALKENGVIYGDTNARITILEFADASCGYCKRQVGQDKTVDAVLDQFPGTVNMIFKNFPIFNETAAQAMACAEDQLSAEDYHKYVVSVFQADDASSVEALSSLAATFGANAETLANCVNNGEKSEIVKATMSEGSKFGISGTPSSVIIDNESGEYRLVPGAYPVETFVEHINELLS